MTTRETETKRNEDLDINSVANELEEQFGKIFDKVENELGFSEDKNLKALNEFLGDNTITSIDKCFMPIPLPARNEENKVIRFTYNKYLYYKNTLYFFESSPSEPVVYKTKIDYTHLPFENPYWIKEEEEFKGINGRYISNLMALCENNLYYIGDDYRLQKYNLGTKTNSFVLSGTTNSHWITANNIEDKLISVYNKKTTLIDLTTSTIRNLDSEKAKEFFNRAYELDNRNTFFENKFLTHSNGGGYQVYNISTDTFIKFSTSIEKPIISYKWLAITEGRSIIDVMSGEKTGDTTPFYISFTSRDVGFKVDFRSYASNIYSEKTLDYGCTLKMFNFSKKIGKEISFNIRNGQNDHVLKSKVVGSKGFIIDGRYFHI